MRVVLIIAVLLLVAASAAAVVPVAEPIRQYLPQAALALAILVLIGVVSQPRQKMPPRSPAAEPARPAPGGPQASRADADIVHFLAMLQEKGRLVDFLMDDINAYSDAQVGAAARVVHAGCKGVLQEHFTINPVRTEQEGSTVQVPLLYSADEYRLVGKIAAPSQRGQSGRLTTWSLACAAAIPRCTFASSCFASDKVNPRLAISPRPSGLLISMRSVPGSSPSAPVCTDRRRLCALNDIQSAIEQARKPPPGRRYSARAGHQRVPEWPSVVVRFS